MNALKLMSFGLRMKIFGVIVRNKLRKMKTIIKFKNILIASLCLMNMLCFGQQMIVDNTFHMGVPANNITYAQVIQPDGKIIVGGGFGLYRLNSDGSIDVNFNPQLDGGNGSRFVAAIALQSDGKILVGGSFITCNGVQRPAIVRLNTDGSIDNSFDAQLWPFDRVRSIVILPNNQIIFGGSFQGGIKGIRKVNVNGTIDNSFDIGTGFNNGAIVNSISLQLDGKIIVAGAFSSFNGNPQNNITRLNPNGTIDISFNIGTGFVLLNFPYEPGLNSSCIQSDGKILIGGYLNQYNGINLTDEGLVRLNMDGTLDGTFNPQRSNPMSRVNCLIQLSSGNILVGSNAEYLDELNYDGSLNTSFVGLDTLDLGGSIYTLLQQTNGRILVGGGFYFINQTQIELNLARLIKVTTNISDTICQGDTYTWNGQTYSQPGEYIQALTNISTIDSVILLNLIVNTNDSITITPNPAFRNAPLNVAFANQTANLSNYNFTWYFGDGTSQQSNAPFLSHIYTQNGYADVTVVANNITTGCSSSQTFNDMIFVIGGVTCTHAATLNQSGPLSGCAGDSILLSCNTDPSYTYQWNRNGIPVSGATSSSFYPTQSGTYTVTIYQNNCAVTSAGISVTFNPLPSVPIITSSGTITPCSGGSMTLTAPSGFSSYLWNTGSTASSLVVSQSGNYSVSVSNSNGCSRTSNPFAVNASFMAAPQVCIVGVDSLTNENRVVWEKPLTLGIDSFYVYKETNVSNVYAKIGATDYNQLAVFLDVNSNPAVQAYRYKISAKDTCGVETNVGDFHKTIHLTINQGIGGAWNLIWSHYEGLNFGSYNIYRGTDPSNISLLTTIQSNLNSYTDLAPPTGPLYYQIEVVNPVNCDPTKIVNYGVSRSNIVNNGVSGVIEILNTNILVYPNPTIDFFYLKSNQSQVGNIFELVDNTGRIVISGVLQNDNQSIDVSKLSRGIYNINILGAHSKTMKLVKN